MFTKYFLALLSVTPLPVIGLVGYVAGTLLWLTPNKKRSIAYINLNYCLPELRSLQRHRLARRSLIHQCQVVLEIPALMKMPTHKLMSKIKTVTGLEYLEAGFKKGNGVILASPHLGNWEIIGLYCSQRFPMTGLYRTQEQSSELDAFIRKGRQRFGAKLVPTDVSGVKALHKALEQNHLTAILPDQNPGKGSGVFAPFFGHPANTMVLLPKLAQRNRSVVLFSYSERLSWGRGYHLHFIPVDDEIYNKDKTVSATVLNKSLEACIKNNPEQYWWSYKRFKVMPDNAVSPYE